MIRDHFIYALVDPRTDETFYIGRTDDLKGRLAAHITRARARVPAEMDGELEPKDAWIRSLGSADPGMRVLQRISAAYVEHAERRWLMVGLDAGWPLTNLIDLRALPLRPLTGERSSHVADMFRVPAALLSPPRFVPLERPYFCEGQSARAILDCY